MQTYKQPPAALLTPKRPAIRYVYARPKCS